MGKVYRQMTEEDKQLVLTMWENGEKIDNILIKSGFGRTTVTDLIKAKGSETPAQRRNRLRGEKAERYAQLWKEGHSISEIARITGEKAENVADTLERTGVRKKPVIMRYNEQDGKGMYEMWKQGKSIKEISKEYHCLNDTVKRYIVMFDNA